MPKVLTSMYQANYENRCYMVARIMDYFRYSYIRLGVLGILSSIPDDLLEVINGKMPEWLGYDDFLKLNVLVKFIKDRVIERLKVKKIIEIYQLLLNIIMRN